MSLLCSLLARKAASGVAGRGVWVLHPLGNPAGGAWVEDDAGQQRRHAGCACMRCCPPGCLCLKMSQAALLDGVGTAVECGVAAGVARCSSDTFGGSQLLCRSSGMCLKDSAFKKRKPPFAKGPAPTCCCNEPAMCVLQAQSKELVRGPPELVQHFRL